MLTGEVAARMHITSGTVTSLLDNLERQNYVVRSSDPDDRRRVLVDITPRVDMRGVEKVQGFMRAHATEGFASVEEAADAVAAYLPHRPRPRSHEGLRKNLRLHPDGRWRWHWDPRLVEGARPVNTRRAEVEEDLIAAARHLRIPALLVRGGSSELVQEAQANC